VTHSTTPPQETSHTEQIHTALPHDTEGVIRLEATHDPTFAVY
jgi:hypothetical protein